MSKIKMKLDLIFLFIMEKNKQSNSTLLSAMTQTILTKCKIC